MDRWDFVTYLFEDGLYYYKPEHWKGVKPFSVGYELEVDARRAAIESQQQAHDTAPTLIDGMWRWLKPENKTKRWDFIVYPDDRGWLRFEPVNYDREHGGDFCDITSLNVKGAVNAAIAFMQEAPSQWVGYSAAIEVRQDAQPESVGGGMWRWTSISDALTEHEIAVLKDWVSRADKQATVRKRHMEPPMHDVPARHVVGLDTQDCARCVAEEALKLARNYLDPVKTKMPELLERIIDAAGTLCGKHYNETMAAREEKAIS